AYTVAILTTKLGWSFWPAWGAACLLTGAAGALLALPAVRAKGTYLAMITIAFAFVVQHGIVEMSGLTGGQNGIMGIASPAIGSPGREQTLAFLASATTIVLLDCYALLARGRWGAAMRAVKDSEIAAESLGISPPYVKTMAFAVSAALAGIAGGLFAPL